MADSRQATRSTTAVEVSLEADHRRHVVGVGRTGAGGNIGDDHCIERSQLRQRLTSVVVRPTNRLGALPILGDPRAGGFPVLIPLIIQH